MSDQLTLNLAPLVVPDYAPDLTIAERFAKFHEANPHVAGALEALAEQWLTTNRRVGVKALIERLRWEAGIQTTATDYRLNNSLTAHYARLLIQRRPEWAERIETRQLRAA